MSRSSRKTIPLPLFMLIVTIAMYAFYSAYWAVDVYLLWADVYLYLPHPLAQTNPGSEYLDGLYIPWTVAYFIPQVFRFIMVMLPHTFRGAPV